MEQPQTMRALETDSLYRRLVGSIATRLNTPFPFYLNDEAKNLALISVLSVFVTAFLYLFKTQIDSPLSEGLQWLHGTITFACLCFNILLLPRILPAAMDPVSWTYKKYIFLNVGHLLLIGVVTTLIEKPLVCPDETWLFTASYVSTQVALKGIIPIVLTTLFLKTRMLQENLLEAIRSNKELAKIQTLKKELPKTSNFITLYSDTSESLAFNLPDLLFIEADDN